MTKRGLNIKLRKKFQGMECRDFLELASKVIEYEELLKEESYLKEDVHGNLLSRGEVGSSSGRSIYYKDIYLSSFGRKGT